MKLFKYSYFYYFSTSFNIIVFFATVSSSNLKTGKTDLVKLSKLYSKIILGELNFNEIFSNVTRNKSLSECSSSLGYDDEKCDLQLNYFYDELLNTQDWAINVFDSWGKLPSGILSGNTFELGNYDQCLKVEYTPNMNSIGTIRGQYCIAPIGVNLENIASLVSSKKDKTPELSSKMSVLGTNPLKNFVNIVIGSCVPAVCDPAYLQQRLKLLLESNNMTTVEVNPYNVCSRDEAIKFDGKDITMIVLLSLIVLLMILSTAYDVITRHFKKGPNQALLAFSVLTNGIKLFSLKQTKSPDVMDCLNGIRVLSILWIIYSHVYLMMLYGVLVNALEIETWINNYHSMIFLSAEVSVDTFLLLSGLLVTWSFFKELEKRHRLNIPLMYFHRYLRLTPSLAMIILFTISLYRYIGKGPLSTMVYEGALTFCNKYWWSALLYIQNYCNPDTICIGHSWYLSVDMQLFVLSPLFLLPLWKWGVKVVGVIVILILIGIAATFGIFFKNNFIINAITGGALSNYEQSKLIYYPTHIRMSPWFVGVLLGYLLFKTKNKQIKLSKYIIAVGWIISMGTIIAIIFGQYNIQQPNYKEILIESAFYASFTRTAWAIGLSWIIFACVKGYGGYINTFLSIPFWLPLARLSYSMYLLHLLIQVTRLKSLRIGDYFDDYNALLKFYGDLGLTITISIFWTLAFESPILILEKVLLRKSPPNQVAQSLEVLTPDTFREAVSESKKT